MAALPVAGGHAAETVPCSPRSNRWNPCWTASSHLPRRRAPPPNVPRAAANRARRPGGRDAPPGGRVARGRRRGGRTSTVDDRAPGLVRARVGPGAGAGTWCWTTPSSTAAAASPWCATSQVDRARHGPGLSTDAIERATERFWRGDDSQRGTGLGLAIAERIITAHDGTLALHTDGGLVVRDGGAAEGAAMWRRTFLLGALALSRAPARTRPVTQIAGGEPAASTSTSPRCSRRSPRTTDHHRGADRGSADNLGLCGNAQVDLALSLSDSADLEDGVVALGRVYENDLQLRWCSWTRRIVAPPTSSTSRCRWARSDPGAALQGERLALGVRDGTTLCATPSPPCRRATGVAVVRRRPDPELVAKAFRDQAAAVGRLPAAAAPGLRHRLRTRGRPHGRVRSTSTCPRSARRTCWCAGRPDRATPTPAPSCACSSPRPCSSCRSSTRHAQFLDVRSLIDTGECHCTKAPRRIPEAARMIITS